MAITTDAFKALGAFTCQAKTPITTASILAHLVDGISIFSTATVAKIKTHDTYLSIDGSDQFPCTYDAISHFETGQTYWFTKETTLMMGRYVTV